MKRRSLFGGAIILLLANAIAKLLGFTYRVALVRILGTEGIGLTEMITPIYSFCLVIGSWGIPLAMSRLIAAQIGRNQQHNIQLICRISLSLLALLGFITTIIAFLASPWLINHFVMDHRTLRCFQILIPAIFIVALCSGYRGYFQGIKQIAYIGFAQNIEQLLRVSIGIYLAYVLLPKGLDKAICAVAIATVIGEFCGLCYMISAYRKYKPAKSASTLKSNYVTKYLFAFGTPVTMQRLLMTILMMLEAYIIPWSLCSSGYDIQQATEIYGRFSGVAMSLLNLPGIFTATLAVAMLPAIAESTQKPLLLEHRINEALQIICVISIPMMFVFYFFAESLCTLIFNAPAAAEPLKILALGAPFLYSQITLTSILQGLGQVKALFINLCIAGVCLIAGLIVLVPLPWLGIKGAAIATILFGFIFTILNLYHLKSFSHCCFVWQKILLKPAFAVLGAVLILKIAAIPIAAIISNEYILAILLLGIFCLIYLALLFILKGVPQVLLNKFTKG